MNREVYSRLWQDATAMRRYLDALLASCPELFPPGIEHGYHLTGCLPGLALTEADDDDHLRDAYGTFREEARDVDPTYTPATVNTDGWKATQKAWRTLFSGIAVILCFLHGFLKVREALEKLWNHRQEYAASYQHPGCHRTSNLVDRLTNRLYRVLYAGRGLHGHQASSERRLRGWALLLNFRPYAPRSGPPREYQSPAHALNGKQYHDHWLHNLQVSASMDGYRHST
jgi:hypothetical protein